MRPFEILAKHYDTASELYGLLVIHSTLVASKSRKIARAYLKRHPRAWIDLEFLTEAALLHDIGIRHCASPKILCLGDEPYARHGVIGREILEGEGLPRHALVCERHTGAGISREEIRAGDLPLPDRDLLPESLEEKIICVADKFYRKNPGKLWKERKPAKIRNKMKKWGDAVVERWDHLVGEFLE